MILRNHSVVIEAASQEDMVEERIRIPALIGDPDVPIALVKEPLRTVKIHPLAHDISSNQIKDALRFCRSDVTKLIFGSSKTDAFVEFEVRFFLVAFLGLSSKIQMQKSSTLCCCRRKMGKREHLQGIQLTYSTRNCSSRGLIHRGQPLQGFQTCQC